MTIDRMRSILSQAYASPKWRLRVLEMPENQVIAIYKSMKETDRISGRKRLKKEPDIERVEQLTIFDMPEWKSLSQHEQVLI